MTTYKLLFYTSTPFFRFVNLNIVIVIREQVFRHHHWHHRSSGPLRDTKHQYPVSYRSTENLRKSHAIMRRLIKY